MNKSDSARDARRWRVLVKIDRFLEPTMVLLGLAWLTLLVVEFVWGLTRWVAWSADVIWVLFVLEFLLRFSIAPSKRTFLRRNWLTLISLALPALRVLRFARAAARMPLSTVMPKPCGGRQWSSPRLARTSGRKLLKGVC